MKGKNIYDNINTSDKKGVPTKKISNIKSISKDEVNSILDGESYETQKLCVEVYEKTINLQKLISKVRKNYWKNKKTVFISYAHEGDGSHVPLIVRKIFDCLDFSSLDTIFDQDGLKHGKETNIQKFMSEGIKRSDKGILIGTPKSKERIDEGNNNISYEYECFRDKEKIKLGYIIPLIISGTFTQSLPEDFVKNFGDRLAQVYTTNGKFDINKYFTNIPDLLKEIFEILNDDDTYKVIFNTYEKKLHEINNLKQDNIQTKFDETFRENEISFTELMNKEKHVNFEHFNNLGDYYSIFSGRENELEALKNSVFTNIGLKTFQFAITGRGGMGKTALARYFANIYGSEYSFLWWVNCKDSLSEKKDFFELAEKLSIPTYERNLEEVVEDIKKFLEKEENTGWLIILDNVKDRESVESKIPKKGGSVILTSRATPKGIQENEGEKLEVLDTKDAIKFILTVINRSYIVGGKEVRFNNIPGGLTEEILHSSQELQQDYNLVQQLSSKLGNFSLALTQVAYYIKNKGITIEKCLEYLEGNKKEILKLNENLDEYELSAFAAMQLSIYELESLFPGSKKLIQLLSFLGENDLPIDVFKHSQVLFDGEKTEFERRLILDSIQEKLMVYPILDFDNKKRTFKIHELLQFVIRNSLSTEEKVIFIKDIIKNFGKELNYDNNNQSSYEIAEKLSKHIIKLGEYVLDEYKDGNEYVNIKQHFKVDFFELLEMIGEYLYNIYGGVQEGNDIFKSLVFNNKNIGNENTIKQVDYYNKLGESLWQTSGEYDKAMVELGKGLKVARDLKYEEGILQSCYLLGLVIFQKGNYEKALDYHFESLNLIKSLFGENHKLISENYNCLGRIYRTIGDHEKAGKYYKLALESLQKFYPENTIYLARIYIQVGANHLSKGNYEKALKYQNKALEINKRELDESHPRFVLIYNNIGKVNSEFGKYEESLDFYNKSLAILAKVSHKYLEGDTLLNVGINYYNWGKKMESTLTQSSLNRIEDVQTKYKLALNNLSTSLNLFLESIGESNIYILENYLYNGLIYFSRKEYKLSETFLQKAEKIIQERIEYINPNLMKIYKNLLKLHKKA